MQPLQRRGIAANGPITQSRALVRANYDHLAPTKPNEETVMNCCDDYGDCQQGRDCPVRNATTRTYPRTLREAFPHAPNALFEQESERGWTIFVYIVGFVTGFVAARIFM